MRHQRRIAQLSRPADQRKALLRGLTTQLIREGRVTTTKARAKALRDETERMITPVSYTHLTLPTIYSV